jgi:hypothetical protein
MPTGTEENNGKLKIVGILAKVQTGHLLNIAQNHYCDPFHKAGPCYMYVSNHKLNNIKI